MTAAIATRGLTKRYDDVPAVDGLDLTVNRGELYGFLGPNGAGKTTTIRMALGLGHPDSGEVDVLGERISHGRGPFADVGALVEEPAFWSYLSGRRNLETFARAGHDSGDVRRRLRRIEEVLEVVGLTDAAGKRVKAYSQGMRQRLGLALALLGTPDLLILDEPTNGLDPSGMREIRQLLRRLADDGTSVFVSSHLLGEVEAVCDRVGVMARGKLVAEGPPRSLRGSADQIRVDVDDPAKARTVLSTLTGAAVADEGATQHLAVLRVRLSNGCAPADVNAALVHAGVRVSALELERDTLEDVFLHLVEGLDVPR